MFKKYRFRYSLGGVAKHAKFYVYSKKSGGAVKWTAVCAAAVPRIDEMDDASRIRRFERNTKVLGSKMWNSTKQPAISDEKWPGQACLVGLWEKLSKLSFIDMQLIRTVNPFLADEEPSHSVLEEKEAVLSNVKGGIWEEA